MKKWGPWIGMIGVCSFVAAAQEVSVQSNSSETTIEKVGDAVKQKKYNQDGRITDLEINAESGSLSRYSMQFMLGYNGPGVTDLSSGEQPNPLDRPGDFRTNITGSIGVRYRMTSDDSLYFSGGVTGYFEHEGTDENPTDLSNPSVRYDHTYAIGALQARTGIILQDTTESYYTGLGEAGGVELSHTMKYDVPNTGWILGAQITAADYFFDRAWNPNHDSAKTSDVYFDLIPSIEYRLTRNLNFNTSYAQGLAHYRSVSSGTTFASDPASQRVGVGWGVTRDIYLNPYFAFYPTALSLPGTWVAINTIFSVF